MKLETLQAYRAQTFRLLPGMSLKDRDDAVAWVKERGFVFFWPIRGAHFPSLWTATAGDRPVADAHDDPGHITWGWKDSLLGGKTWYYAKVLRKKATMISMALAPYFYALSENYGSIEDDHLILYEQGRLTQEAKAVYEAILDEGALDTVALRRAARLSSPESEARFTKALADLQAAFRLVPVAVTKAGAWHYAFAYDITARHYPEIVEQARFLGELDARDRLAESYFRAMGAALPGEVSKLFGWRTEETRQTLERLAAAGTLRSGIEIEGLPGIRLALSSLVAG
ncbi:MAG: winged helix DNA-binding domain-containing protein [Chloroflexi bacterium]|nr:winged helix DNA-binding domain-containing protein [Chloroflexota bacterium]